MDRLTIIGLAILAVGLVVLLATNSSGAVLGLDSDDFARLVYAGALLAVFSGLFLARRNLSGALRNLAIWLLILLALVAGYQYRYELQEVASRVTAGIVPGSPMTITDSAGRKTVMLDAGPDGHFQARATVDGTALRLLVDTGATSTVLSHADAARIGLHTAALAFNVPISTANGVTRAAAARVGEIRLGELVRADLPVLVAAEGALEQSLLGMNFIATLSGFEIRGGRLILND